jgi:hypothetical protein
VGEDFPRSLNANERAALDYMLSAQFPGVEELRLQAASAQVVSRCTCGCATINLSVEPVESSTGETTPRVVAIAATNDFERTDCTHLMLWVDDTDDGRRLLSGVEVSWIENPPTEFPPPEFWEPPEPFAP